MLHDNFRVIGGVLGDLDHAEVPLPPPTAFSKNHFFFNWGNSYSSSLAGFAEFTTRTRCWWRGGGGSGGARGRGGGGRNHLTTGGGRGHGGANQDDGGDDDDSRREKFGPPRPGAPGVRTPHPEGATVVAIRGAPDWTAAPST